MEWIKIWARAMFGLAIMIPSFPGFSGTVGDSVLVTGLLTMGAFGWADEKKL